MWRNQLFFRCEHCFNWTLCSTWDHDNPVDVLSFLVNELQKPIEERSTIVARTNCANCGKISEMKPSRISKTKSEVREHDVDGSHHGDWPIMAQQHFKHKK